MSQEERTRSIELYRSSIDQPNVQMELGWAEDYKKPIITVFEGERTRPGYFDFNLAVRRYKNKSVHNGKFASLFDISAVEYRRGAFQGEAMVKEILAIAETRIQATAAASSPPASPINPPGQWDFFLSHGQKDGGDQMNVLMQLLKQCGKKVWLDVAMVNKDVPAMEEGVKNSTVVIVFLTGDPTEHQKAVAAAGGAGAGAGAAVGGGGRGGVAAAGGGQHNATSLGIEERLGKLIAHKEQGHLTDEEFTKAKAKLLAEESPS